MPGITWLGMAFVAHGEFETEKRLCLLQGKQNQTAEHDEAKAEFGHIFPKLDCKHLRVWQIYRIFLFTGLKFRF